MRQKLFLMETNSYTRRIFSCSARADFVAEMSFEGGSSRGNNAALERVAGDFSLGEPIKLVLRQE